MWLGSGVAMSYGVGLRHGLDLALLWLWCKLAAMALILSLAWDPPYVPGCGPKMTHTKKISMIKD